MVRKAINTLNTQRHWGLYTNQHSNIHWNLKVMCPHYFRVHHPTLHSSSNVNAISSDSDLPDTSVSIN